MAAKTTEPTWELEGKVLPRCKVEEVLRDRCHWWWRRTRSAHVVWDGYKMKAKSGWGKQWKQFREMSAFRYELARRRLAEEDLPPYPKAGRLRHAFASDPTFGPVYPMPMIQMAKANAGSGQIKVRPPVGKGRAGAPPAKASDWLAIVDLSYSAEEIDAAIRQEKRLRAIEEIKGSESSRWAKVPWRWVEMLDIVAAVKTPRLDDKERKKRSEAERAARAFGKHLRSYLFDPS